MLSLTLLALACATNDFGFTLPDEQGGPGLDAGFTGEPGAGSPWTAGDSIEGWLGGAGSDGGSDPVGDGGAEASDAEVTLAWQLGTTGEDRTSALARTSDGGLLVAGALGLDLADAADHGLRVVRLGPEGDVAWSRTLGPPAAGLSITDVLPQPDGSAWVCLAAPPAAELSPEVGALPEDWGDSFLLVRLDPEGMPDAIRGLGSRHGGRVMAGCGQDASGRLFIDGTISGGPAELLFEVGSLELPSLADRGFVLILDEDAWLDRMGTWDGHGLQREASAVRPDGTVVQACRYTGLPELTVGTAQLPPCPPGDICMGLLETGTSASLEWLAGMGPDVEAGLRLHATEDGGLLASARMGPLSILPAKSGYPGFLASSGTLLARYDEALVLEWALPLDSELFVQAIDEDSDGLAWIGMWTGAAEELRIDDEVLELEGDMGTTAVATVAGGETTWLWAASGDGVAWPSDLEAEEGEVVLGAVFSGSLLLDPDGPSETELVSTAGPDGEASMDMAVVALEPF